jgi:hypothetical protein
MVASSESQIGDSPHRDQELKAMQIPLVQRIYRIAWQIAIWMGLSTWRRMH